MRSSQQVPLYLYFIMMLNNQYIGQAHRHADKLNQQSKDRLKEHELILKQRQVIASKREVKVG